MSQFRSTGRHYYTGASIAGLKGERKILSQGEWVDKKRTERPADFAPPSNYDKGVKKTQQGKRVPQAGNYRECLPGQWALVPNVSHRRPS